MILISLAVVVVYDVVKNKINEAKTGIPQTTI